jgi:L-fuconolactonase
MRIDMHLHFWRFKPVEFERIGESMSCLRRDFRHEDLKPELDGAGFDGAIAVQACQTIEGSQ